MKKSRFFALIGLLLGTGAPLGALLIRSCALPHAHLENLLQDLSASSFFYVYTLIGTCLAFSLFGYFIGRDEEKILRKNVRLSVQALTDPLTGLGSHRFLHETFKVEFRKHRDSRKPISCLMMDLDFFKKVNDSHGHPFGDKVLFLFAQVVRHCLRSGDIATRYGGEEFLCILPDCDEKEARAVAERIRAELEGEVFRDGPYDVKVTVSIGAVTVHESLETDHQSMIDAADKNLYEAKDRGRNQVFQTTLDRSGEK